MEKKESPLKNEKVKIVPITDRKGGWLPKGHDGAFMYTGAKRRLPVPQGPNGQLLDPLSEDERAFFESPESGIAMKPGDLSVYKKQDNYWERFEIILDKNGLDLDLSNPIDYFKLKVLKLNSKEIAPSFRDRHSKGSYKFYIMESGEEFEVEANKADLMKRAWKEYGKMEESLTRMRNFLTLYCNTYEPTRKVPKSPKREWLISEISKVIEKDITGYLKVIEDKDYDMKLFINECVDGGVITREGKTVYHALALDGRFNNIKELIIYLNDGKNQENLMLLKAQLENTK